MEVEGYTVGLVGGYRTQLLDRQLGCEWVGCSNTLEDNVKQLRIAFGEVECDFMQVVGGWERWDWGGLARVLIFVAIIANFITSSLYQCR